MVVAAIPETLYNEAKPLDTSSAEVLVVTNLIGQKIPVLRTRTGVRLIHDPSLLSKDLKEIYDTLLETEPELIIIM